MTNRTQEEIMQNWGVDNSDTPLLSVRCITYNHEPYIAQALDGFLMQKTDFPFEVIVHDDASTDKTAGIIREYEAKFPKIIKPIYETENQYSKHDGSLDRIVNTACKGKYIALCEGDDYWIDENKLQMQVDFLERNPEYGMCYTKAKMFVQKKEKFSKNVLGWYVVNFDGLLQNGNRIPTLTVVARKNLLNRYSEEIHPEKQDWLMGDYPLWLYIFHESRGKFFEKVTSVYRVLEDSASHSNDIEKSVAFAMSTWNIQNFFSQKYSHRCFSDFDEHLVRAYLHLMFNNRKSAKNEFLLCKVRTNKIRIYVVLCSSEVLFFILRKLKHF